MPGVASRLVPAATITSGGRRWAILAVGTGAQAATTTFQFGLPFLLPQLLELTDGSLPLAGVLVAAPGVGLALTLILWGWAADTVGERTVMALGLALASALLLLAPFVADAWALGVLLVLAGAASASVNSASGRVVLAWFAPHERGLAMGVRQTAQPIGVALAAATFPALATAGIGTALLVPAALCGLFALLARFVIVDPPRTSGSAPPSPRRFPYREAALWRVHLSSVLLVVPQFTITTYSFLYLVSERGWRPGTAGAVLAVTQLAGAAVRLLVGWWSDVVGERLRPIRLLAVGNAAVLALLTAGVLLDSPAAVPLLLGAGLVTVSSNGLAFAAVAELAGRRWAGRALGAQNTAQNIASTATPAPLGALVAGLGFGAAFAVAIVFPVLAALVVPGRRDDPVLGGEGA